MHPRLTILSRAVEGDTVLDEVARLRAAGAERAGLSAGRVVGSEAAVRDAIDVTHLGLGGILWYRGRQ